MLEKLTFSIGVDGDITVRSFDELQKWLEKERAQWAWLVRGDKEIDRHNIATNTQNVWDNLITDVQAVRNNGQALTEARASLGPLVGQPLLVSTTEKGAAVLDIKETVGAPAAAFASMTCILQFENILKLKNDQEKARTNGSYHY